MCIQEYTFTSLSRDESPRPMLWVRIINPREKTQTQPLLAQVDTGSDMCCFPSDVAEELGHKLESVKPVSIVTPFGEGIAFLHTTVVEILGKNPETQEATEEVLYTIPERPIHFVRDGHSFYLGVDDFLHEFVLNINFPYQTFSINHP